MRSMLEFMCSFIPKVAKKETEMKPIEYKNESERLRSEFVDLSFKNEELKDLIEDANNFTNENFGKSIMITMIDRTQAEQDSIYKDNPKYKKKKFKSPHQFFQAVDLRSRSFTASEIEELVGYINSKYDASNYYKWTAKCHNVGKGDHFHIQFCKD